jgi:hypothetical protein
MSLVRKVSVEYKYPVSYSRICVISSLHGASLSALLASALTTATSHKLISSTSTLVPPLIFLPNVADRLDSSLLVFGSAWVRRKLFVLNFSNYSHFTETHDFT